MAGLYTTTKLLEVQRKINSLPAFFLTFFPRQINFEEDEIAFDKVSTNYKRLAPFVAPNVQGKIIKESGFRRIAFTPAYVKPKHIVDPTQIIPVQPGEAPGTGTLTLAQRRAAHITHLLRVHKTMHENRHEWMAAQAVIYGYVDVEGDEYPKQRVDFGRDPGLTVTTDWTAVGATPLKDIYAARRLAHEASTSGVTITRIIFGQDAWDRFFAKEQEFLKDLWDKNTSGSQGDVTKLWNGFEGVEYLGAIVGSQGGGRLEFWLNTQKYTDEAGQSQYLLPQNAAIGVSSAIDGVRCFGAIMDATAGYQAMDMYPKNWVSDDPSVEYLMTQGAPLMVPADPNGSFLIRG